MRRFTLRSIGLGAALCLLTGSAVAQESPALAIAGPISEIRAAALVGDTETVHAAVEEVLATDDPRQLFELARLMTNMPSEHMLPTADYTLAVALYRRVAELLDRQPGRDSRNLLNRARHELGTVLLHTATSEDNIARAKQLIEQSAASGYGRAALRLGEGLAAGEFGQVRADEAILWLRRALNLGVGEAAVALSAQLHRQGSGEVTEEEQSLARLGLSMLRSEALQGDEGAARALADAYLDHPTIPRDVVEADRWLQFAIGRGDAEAMTARARLILEGALGAPDPAAAGELLEAAAAEGSTSAAIMLAETLDREREGTLRVDPAVARAWLDRALAVREPRAYRLAAQLSAQAGDLERHRALLEQAYALGDFQAGIDLIGVLTASGEIDAATATMAAMERRIVISNGNFVGLADLKLDADPGSPLHDPAGGLSLLLAAAERGDDRALYRLGELHLEGPRADPGKAVGYFRRSAEQGNFRALLRLAEAHASGTGVAQSMDEAEVWLERARVAAVAGESDRMVDLGRVLVDGVAGGQGIEEGVEWLRRAVDRGNPRAMVALAASLLDGTAGQFDPEQALALYEAAVAAGDLEANFYIGRAYSTGLGAPVDLSKAVEHFRIAANAGDSAAATELGLIYSSGGEFTTDNELSYQWLRRAADAGHVPAMVYLSNLIAMGTFADVAEETAMSWLVRAAQTGDSDAQFQLAIALERGLLGDPDVEGAEHWLREASRNGHFQAAAELQRLLHEQERES